MQNNEADFDNRFEVDSLNYQRETIDQKMPIRLDEFMLLFLGFGIRPLSKLALLVKTGNFCADLSANFEDICQDMIEKLDVKDAKRGYFNAQSEFRKRSIISLKFEITPL